MDDREELKEIINELSDLLGNTAIDYVEKNANRIKIDPRYIFSSSLMMAFCEFERVNKEMGKTNDHPIALLEGTIKMLKKVNE